MWFSDLRGFTRITDTAPPEQVIPLLNDYAEAVISAVHEAGGDVLKLIGDGTLAIFKADDPARACRSALAAEARMRERVAALNARRAAAGLPVTGVYLGLHVGEVFYGNIGSPERLDFTVIGPAVNEASRIAAMCRSVERDVLLSVGVRRRRPRGGSHDLRLSRPVRAARRRSGARAVHARSDGGCAVGCPSPRPGRPPAPRVLAALLPIMAVVLIAFLVIGLALPVLPLHVHQGLGLGTFVVGLVAGSQFAASLVSRVWSGHYADSRGAKQRGRRRPPGRRGVGAPLPPVAPVRRLRR